jgi:predicted nuclease of predicted toxin-antitoxin system
MQVLLDQNTPIGLKRVLNSHQVIHADEVGWGNLGNGDLLAMAESLGYEVMVTCDKNIVYQQNLAERRISLIVLSTNNWAVIRAATTGVVEAVNVAVPGSYAEVQFERPPLRRRPRSERSDR